MGLLPAACLAVCPLQAVKLALVVKGFRFRPDAPHYRQILIRPAIARVVIQPVPVLSLLHIIASGDDVQGDASVGQLVQGCRLAGGQSRRHETRTMGNQIPQPLRMRRRVARHFKAVGRGRRIARKHQVKPGGLVGARKVQDIGRVNTRRHFGAGVDAAAKQAEGSAAVGFRFPYHPNHSDNGDAVGSIHAGRRRFRSRRRRHSLRSIAA